MWAIFIVFIQSVTILFLLDVWLPSMWDLGSLTRDWTCTPCIGRWSLPLDHEGSPKLDAFYTPTMNNWKRKLTNSIYNSIRKNTILRNKLNQGGKRFVYWKLQSIAERNKTQINGETPCVHRLEDNIVKMSIVPKAIYRGNAISIQIPVIFFLFFEEVENFTLHWKFKH